ncbi:HpcH/HpaI aldolase/citrate lyase family protein [Gordonia pseudamarae]|jgi:citrate lyase beta subunit|uniref:Aldolase n=1 Tax=Gordonia pseudamarae TaxID=2831662 RepID=A0ABX6IK80_9ACTN|nr:HpcH/HpaI aldolase/citrate lyase family protein [Gordonia pseudamarae]QHN35516.1 aldolase [Gordonia pseudamarae]
MSAGDSLRILAPAVRGRIDDLLGPVDADLAAWYPGDDPVGQPAHTVYVSAADAGAGTAREWGERALVLAADSAHVLAELAGEQAVDIALARLRTNPIEDLRIDLEDGYGWRPDDVEDAHARAAGHTLRAWSADDAHAPRSFGVRAKGLGAAERDRGLRTLELVLDAAGGIPDGFVFTVPKLRDVRQVDAVIVLCEEFERVHGVPAGTLRFELQIEIPQAVLGPDGTATLARAIHRGRPRLSGLHYGTYDYSAACGIVSAHQSPAHPAADHAKAVMQAAAAQTGVWLSDGSTQVLPTGSPDNIAAALRRHHGLVVRSLERGIYQGWDMHPGHLVTRWLAVVGFFRDAMPGAATRLQAYFERSGGDVADEPATAMSLSLVIERGIAAGAFTFGEVTAIAPLVTAPALGSLRAGGGALTG